GLSATVVQSRAPWRQLQVCRENNVRVILNHRPRDHATTGHYTVLVDVDESEALLHDPQFGPHRREPRQALLSLWLPSAPISEITGNVMVALTDAPAAPARCKACDTEIP